MEVKSNQIIVNVFEGGQVADIDPSRNQNKTFVNAKNIRLFDLDGHGFVVVNIKGSKLLVDQTPANNNIGFEITEGFIPLGGCVFNGIMFLFSCYKTPVANQEYHIGEIGCFPSLTNGVFTREYKPLQNFKVGESYVDFRTENLRFRPDHRIEVVPWQDSDGSVNLYFSDFYNPLRVVNCGFDFDGNSNGVYYSSIHFPNAINLVLGSGSPMVVGDPQISNGGGLHFGNHFFFFQYVNSKFNSTHFISESRPVQIYDGEMSVAGCYGGKGGHRSSKQVKFALSNLDQAFSFVRVGFIRYLADDIGAPVFEAGIIDRDYPIDGATMDLIVTGTEGTRVVSIEEIVANRMEDDRARTILPLDKRLWGANWDGPDTHHPSMATFALSVTADYTTEEIDGSVFNPAFVIVPGEMNGQGDYRDPYKTANKAGYFRTEAYPFALRFMLNNGYLSNPYPITGIDLWKTASGTNTKGIVRFPGNDTAPMLGTAKLNLMALKLDFSTAIANVKAAASTDSLAWIRDNVVAIYVVRGDRYKSMLYQGIVLNGAVPMISDASKNTGRLDLTSACSVGVTGINVFPDGYNDDSDDDIYRQTFLRAWEDATLFANQDPFWGAEKDNDIDNIDTKFENEANVHIPLYRGYAPHMAKTNTTENRKIKNRNYMSRWYLLREKLCVFSPDFMFTPIGDVSGIKYMKSIGKTVPTKAEFEFNGFGSAYDRWTHNGGDFTVYSDMYPRWQLFEQTGMGTPAVSGDSNIRVSKVGENADIMPQSNINGFVNAIKDYWSSDTEAMWWAEKNDDAKVWSNRSVKTPKYIGIDLLGIDDYAADDDYNLDIVSLYSNSDPYNLDITSLFSNIANVRYGSVGHPIVIDWDTIDEAEYDEVVFFGGDCFLQRTYFKVNAWAGTSFDGEGYSELTTYSEEGEDNPEGSNGKSKFTFGVVIGIVTENAINTAMRVPEGGQVFYPYMRNVKSFAKKAHNEETKESFLVNAGYNVLLPPRQSFGHDIRFNHYDKKRKGRVRYSDPNIPGAFIDGFRIFRPEAKVDFPIADGEIMKIMDYQDNLVTIHTRAINMHGVNERQMMPDPTSGEFVLGKGEILSDKSKELAKYGSQHQWSICKDFNDTIYGVDFDRRIIWSLGKVQLSLGSTIGVTPISQTGFIDSIVNRLFDTWNPRADIAGKFPDAPMSDRGIVSVYDPKNKEIYFVFCNYQYAEALNWAGNVPAEGD